MRLQTRRASAAILGLCLSTLTLAVQSAAHAQTNAVDLTGGLIESAADNGDSSYVIGWSFTVQQSLTVTALGYYDDNNEAAVGTAMTTSHAVGIFTQSDGTLIAQAIVNPDDTNIQTLADGALFRYNSNLADAANAPIPSFVLLPGVTYDIAGVTNSDYYEYLPDTFSTAPDVSYIQDQYADGGNVTSLTDPSLSYGNNYGGITGQGFFGPNFQYTVTPASTATPEPSGFTGLCGSLLGLLGLGLRARCRRWHA